VCDVKKTFEIVLSSEEYTFPVLNTVYTTSVIYCDVTQNRLLSIWLTYHQFTVKIHSKIRHSPESGSNVTRSYRMKVYPHV
jgi:hypothetical protein